jgi:hypothetical protein
MNVVVVTTAKTDAGAKALLKVSICRLPIDQWEFDQWQRRVQSKKR